MNIDIINPCTHPHWDDLLHTHPKTNFFHTAAWAKVLNISYGYKPLYFTIIDNGNLAGLIPVMEINSFLTGKRAASLPFTDVCDPVIQERHLFERLFENVINYGRKAGWKSLEIHGGEAFLDKEPAAARVVVHTLALGQEEAEISQAFRDSTYRNIRKAQKAGVTVNLEQSHAAMTAFYRLHCETRRHHGLPPQPWSFFKNICEFVIDDNKGFLAVAKHLGKVIAAAVFVHFHKGAIFKFGASDRNKLGHRPNNLLMWQAIAWCCENGFRSLDLGRTATENMGLLQYKDGWGAKKAGVSYYKYDFRGARFHTHDSGPKSSYRVFRMMPTPLLRLTGKLLYRHVG